MNVIFERRSIRKYTDEPVPIEKLFDFVKAGMSAPSAGNQQPWHFITITDRSLLQKIPEFHPHSRMLKDAPAAICVCGDPALEKHPGFWLQDCAAATENILLEITAQGYGGVWIGVYPVEDRISNLRRLLGIPENIVPFCLISLGRPAERKEPKDLFRADRVHLEKWA
ncbi:MAG: nitroreductase family protein [Spirochaetia bacterium]|jgi:nitroreductase